MESVVEKEGEHLESLPLFFGEVFDIPRTEDSTVLELRDDLFTLALAGRFGGLGSLVALVGGDGNNRLGNLDLESLSGEGGEGGKDVGGEHSKNLLI